MTNKPKAKGTDRCNVWVEGRRGYSSGFCARPAGHATKGHSTPESYNKQKKVATQILSEMCPDERALMYKRRNLRQRFNITLEERNAILAAQNGVCAGCGKPESAFKTPFAVDHDHHTMLLRGMLCWPCNSMLPASKGHLAIRLRALADYLDDPPAQRIIPGRTANRQRRRSRKSWGWKTKDERER